jgi:diguanylate cyclase (GGDEF)-like protein/PAS domain S-box-containing protein
MFHVESSTFCPISVNSDTLITNADQRGFALSRLIALEQAAITQNLSWKAGATRFIGLAPALLSCDRASLWWSMANADSLRLLASRDDCEDCTHQAPLSIQLWECLWQQGYVAIDDIAALPHALPKATTLPPDLLNAKTQAVYLLPLQAADGRGVVIYECQQRQHWSAPDLWAGRSLGQSLLNLYHHHHQRQLRQDLAGQATTLNQYWAELAQTTQAWQESQHFIQSIVNASTCIVYLYDRHEDRVIYSNQQIQAHLGYSEADIAQLRGSFLQAVTHGEDLDPVQQQRQDWWHQASGQILQVEYRVQAKDGRWRWLLVREARFNPDGAHPREQVIGTATDITDFKTTEVALRSANAKLQQLAITDELTKLANRRHFDRCLQETWQKMACIKSPVALILCDIDYFKRYNDTYGHPAGDRCLQQVAQLIFQSAQRQADVVSRYGGEEFAILMPNTNATGAQAVAQRIQTLLASQPIDHFQNPLKPQVTVSLGIATLVPVLSQSAQALVSAADAALYQAKSAGRDRYHMAAPTTDSSGDVPAQ